MAGELVVNHMWGASEIEAPVSSRSSPPRNGMGEVGIHRKK